MGKSIWLPLICALVALIVSNQHQVNCKTLHPSDVHPSENEVTSDVDIIGQQSQPFLTKLISHIFQVFNLRQVLHDVKESKTTDGTCYSCKFGIALLQHLIEYGKGRDELADLAHTICMTLHVETPRVCKGIVTVFKDEFVTVISKLALSPTEICGIILGDACAVVYNPLHNWTIPLSHIPKPPLDPNPSPSPPGTPILRVLHLSDTHIDSDYAVGGDAVCGEPLCCRSTSKVLPKEEQSGFWGDYRDCDVPLRTLDRMLKHISVYHKDIDFVLWTGDVPPHDIWNQTRKGQIKLLQTVSQLMDRHLNNTPIFPALGNHESAPVNSFPPPSVKGNESTSWLYDELEEIWSKWLPKETQKTINKGAYYSVMVKPGLKLISLNMNYCNNQNWWLLLNTTDPADELMWLISQLQTSELLHQKVHIIGHIPPGSNDCLQVWSKNYYRIVNRFEATIAGQFFGHTHQDEFQIFYDEEDEEEEGERDGDGNQTQGVNLSIKFPSLRPTSIAYVGPSVTTFGAVNPGYRIYSVDSQTFQVLDHETYFLNLTEANIYGEKKPLNFQSSYNARDAYGMSSLEPKEWHRILLEMVGDEKLFQQFYRYFYNRSDYLSHKPCDSKACKSETLCRLVSGKSHDITLCRKFIKDLELL